eukprot:GHVT01017185.1.p1 GENE.GHVT01017185.1~~GHVT01017185.1.p1  ORF type:complete len:446 (-),score=125.33 GHVT01017185.1:2963-4300(-)
MTPQDSNCMGRQWSRIGAGACAAGLMAVLLTLQADNVGGGGRAPKAWDPRGLEELLDGAPVGGEAFAQDSRGRILTTAADGRILRFAEEHAHRRDAAEIVGYTGPRCAAGGPACARPLGIRGWPGNDRLFVVADAFSGLVAVRAAAPPAAAANSTAGEAPSAPSFSFSSAPFSPDGVGPAGTWLLAAAANGVQLRLLDGLDFLQASPAFFGAAQPGAEDALVVVATDASQTVTLDKFVFALLDEKPNGRLIAYRTKDGHVSVPVEGLAFPNGVATSHDGRHVLVTLTLGAAVGKLTSEGRWEQCVEGLPFLPDNIQRHPKRRTYIVAGAMACSPRVLQLVRAAPIAAALRWLLSKAGSSKRAEAWVERGMRWLGRPGAYVAEIDENCQLVGTVVDPSGRIKYLAEAFASAVTGDVFLGSFRAGQPLFRLSSAAYEEAMSDASQPS